MFPFFNDDVKTIKSMFSESKDILSDVTSRILQYDA